MNRRIPLALGAALLVAAAGAAWYFARNGGDTPKYRFAKVEKGPITQVVAATGTLNPVTSVQVGSQVSGQIKEIFVDFNSVVKANQLIARIDPETFESRVRQNRADLDSALSSLSVSRAQLLSSAAEIGKAKVTLADAKRDLDRKVDLVAKNFISPSERDKAQTTYEVAVEQLRAAEAQRKVVEGQVSSAEAAVKQREALLKQAQLDLERTHIRSPIDGVVINRAVDAGQTVAASLQTPTLFTIARNLNDMQVDTSIDESEIGKIREAQNATFTVDAFAGRTFNGKVVQVRKAAQVSQNVVTYTVVVSAPNPDLTLLPGMTANVRVVTASKDSVLKVPNAALRFKPPGSDASPASRADTKTSAEAPKGEGGGDARERGQQLRQRLVSELKLDTNQQQQLDAIFAEQRNNMASLREIADEAERRKALERARNESRERIRGILKPEQAPIYERLVAEQAGRSAASGQAYVVGSDGKAQPVSLRLGLTDGNLTEIVSGDLKEGQDVITGLDVKAEPKKSSTPGVAPKMF